MFVIAAFATAIVFLVLFLVQTLGGTSGGWRSLSQRFVTDHQPHGLLAKHQTLQIGAGVYKRCVVVGIADEGLYLTIFRKTALIPWTEIKEVKSTTLYWQSIPQLIVGDPCITTVAVPNQLFGQLKEYLDTPR